MNYLFRDPISFMGGSWRATVDLVHGRVVTMFHRYSQAHNIFSEILWSFKALPFKQSQITFESRSFAFDSCVSLQRRKQSPGRDTFDRTVNCVLVRMLVIITLEVRAYGAARVTLRQPRALK